MKIGIAMGWRPQPTRISAWEAVCNHYSKQIPGVKLFMGDYPSEEYNYSASRNTAMEKAIKAGCDVVMMSDADFIIETESFVRGAKICYQDEKFVVGYDQLYLADEQTSQEIIQEGLDWSKITSRSEVNIVNVGGAVFLTPLIYKTINGWDERFQNWGYEDKAIYLAASILVGSVKLNGLAVALYHLDRNQSNLRKNADLYYEYEIRQHQPEEMLKLVTGNKVRDQL
jgi:predicted glycosyltransferase involved in capsule biosynthesis